MNHIKYQNRTNNKFKSALEYYAAAMWEPILQCDTFLGYTTEEHLRIPPAADMMQPLCKETPWGGEYQNLWVSCDITVPAEADGKILGAIVDAEAVEVLCFRDNKPVGLINSKNQFLGGMHSAMFVSSCAKAGEIFRLSFECYAGHTCLGCSPYDSYNREDTSLDNTNRTFHGVKLVVLDEIISDFLFDTATVVQLAELSGENYVAKKAINCLNNAFAYLIQDVREASREELRASCQAVCKQLAPALEKTGGDRSRGYVGVIGHSHMDTAWLWPVSETIRKCARTYSQVLTYMDMYPDYMFIQSSALHLDWMREYYPAIFEGIRRRVAEGRYEPNGGVWVECDCNVTGGESMVRQFLYGQRFTQKYLGYRSDSFWLPDTFGYNSAIPQIMQKSGVKYFYTTKLSWNDLNTFPADTFLWEGVDGSRVITHLNRMHLIPNVESVTQAITEKPDKASSDKRLLAYGFGDGGGGPTYDMLEFLQRTKNLDGLPQMESTTVSRFMQKIEENVDELPLYAGELYLELHRGTLTQMHEVKKNNRKGEIALRNMELLQVLSGEKTPEERDAYYKILLKNQFHDILPGTSISKVYDIAIPEMHEMINAATSFAEKYLKNLTISKENTLSAFNPLSFARNAVTVFDGAFSAVGYPSQTYSDADGNVKTAVNLPIDAMSAVSFQKAAAAENVSAFIAEGNTLITPYYKVVFDADGYISSLYDVEEDREIKNPNGAPLGTLWFGEDMPANWDNWDIDDDIFHKLEPVRALLSSEVVADGAVEYRMRRKYAIGKNSTATLDTVFYAADRRVDYEMTLDWAERHALLKAGFDLNLRTTFVKNEIQFGHIDRPTTRNNSLEDAKFEVCNHKWSDLSETRYGVALLNDCKYGISAEGSDLRLTLHKGGCRPDPFTDNGHHTMTYSLLPHQGAFSAETVVRPAYELNYAPVITEGVADVPKLFELSHPGIICEAVKPAEDNDNAMVLRLYESERNHSNCKVTLHGAKHVYVTNLLEEKEEELQIAEDGSVKLHFTPFEIKTLLVER